VGGVVLMTGASSFTGLWICEALAAAGFQVIAPLQRPRADYEGVRLERVQRLEAVAEVVFDRPFGSTGFEHLIGDRPAIDALVLHGAHVAGFREPGYDATEAFNRNTAGAPAVFRLAAERGARVVIATGTVFEAGEGGAPAEPQAVTAYGLGKTLTNIAFAHHAAWTGLGFGKVVIPSPYGVFEERRFGWHLFRSWFAGETPQVRTPLYVRDHIPAPMLAAAYARHVQRLLADPGAPALLRPSGWIASQGEFGRKVAAEAGRRLGRACPLDMGDQTVLEEPYLRVNSDPDVGLGWNEAGFWDDYVGWYARLDSQGALN
jgi:nucleoside-diphosphate-sugar epimerase